MSAVGDARKRLADVANPLDTVTVRHGYATTAALMSSLPIGTPVLAWPCTRDGSPLVTRTRSAVWALGDGTRVVAVEGQAGGIALSHVDILPAPIGGAA